MTPSLLLSAVCFVAACRPSWVLQVNTGLAADARQGAAAAAAQRGGAAGSASAENAGVHSAGGEPRRAAGAPAAPACGTKRKLRAAGGRPGAPQCWLHVGLGYGALCCVLCAGWRHVCHRR